MSSAQHNVEFIANPIQRKFIESKAHADLFAARMGEGKSAALVMACIYHTQRNPGARWAFIRDTWENLRDTTQKEFFEWFPPGVFGEWVASTKTFKWMVGGIEGEVVWIGMDDEKDASKLQSRSLAGFAMDEPAPAAASGGIDEMIFNTAMTRLRQKGMAWYGAKLAENNPDEAHWTYRRFVEPGAKDYACWQTREPENELNLPPEYYAHLRKDLSSRPDLVRRFADGKFGFQRTGRPVTPEWNDAVHLHENLKPVGGYPLTLCWDWGLNPTCCITQITPEGHWDILEAFVGEEIGALELIEGIVKPRLQQAYSGLEWMHTGDPMGSQREQSSSENTAVRVLKRELGGQWKPGPTRPPGRLEPLQAALGQLRNGTGLIRVDKNRATAVWRALRGGWHYPASRSGVLSGSAAKDIHSHPGDSISYGAALLFPLGKLKQRGASRYSSAQRATYFNRRGLGFEQPGLRVPEHGEPLRGTNECTVQRAGLARGRGTRRRDGGCR